MLGRDGKVNRLDNPIRFHYKNRTLPVDIIPVTRSPMVPNPPSDMPRITPHIFYDDVAAAMDWLVKAFGFEVRLRMTDDAAPGGVVHGELEVADSLVMLGLAGENELWVSPRAIEGRIISRLYIFVDDVDTHYQRAIDGGARITRELADQWWGDRVYECFDPEGHCWKFAQHMRDVDNRTLKRPTAVADPTT
jgi:uncharacterized glyoxalase superfamily protein PhnB